MAPAGFARTFTEPPNGHFPDRVGVIVGERVGLFRKLIPHRDGGLDNLDLSGPALPFPGEVLGEQRLDDAREVFRDLANVCKEILIER
jgi:hypothetical protein